jgi:hypothetical protein
MDTFSATLTLCLAMASADWAATAQKNATEKDEVRRVLRVLDRKGHPLLGASVAEVRQVKGAPSEILDNGRVWIYWHPLGAGAHSFRFGASIRFSNGRVSRVDDIERPVGCILVLPTK